MNLEYPKHIRSLYGLSEKQFVDMCVKGKIKLFSKTKFPMVILDSIANSFYEHRENVVLKLNCNQMEWNGKDYYVYVCPVDAENHKLLAEPTYIEVTVDDSKKPVVEWVVTENMKWNEAEEYYELYVDTSSEITLSYTLTNPAEGGMVKVNVSDYNSVFVKNSAVVDNENKTVTLTIDAYHADKNNHHATVELRYAHETDNNWNWNIDSKTIRVIHKAPAETPAE